MVKYQFETYARMKPVDNVLEILVPRNPSAGHVNNQREAYEFKFKDVFDQNSQQEEVFDKVAKPLTLSCMDGYNGTIFAYGQTGSGKTYTMCGADTWSLRGIIPRIFTLVFEELEARSHIDYNVYVTFMEIYNESAFDLLDGQHAEQPLDNWTKIQLYEDQYGNLHMKNLSIHQVRSEQDGIDLLMMGNFIRQVSSTPMNMASSRSHCIFTLAFESREPGSEIIRSSKLHLVDLAGSERIAKSNISGKTLMEAKHINLSLTYLEQVIIALHEREQDQRMHIPYRNSLMTTILRDSLGGNCKTVLVATMNSETDQLEETISTARFALRCSKLTSEVTINEQVDVNLMVQRLKVENSQLKEQLAGMSQDSRLGQSVTITGQDSELCKKQINTKAQAFRCLQLFREAMRIKDERYMEEIERLRQQLNS